MRIVIIVLAIIVAVVAVGLLMKVRPQPAQETTAPSQQKPANHTDRADPTDPTDRSDRMERKTPSASSPSSATEGSISGRVYESESGNGRAGIQVEAFVAELHDNVKATTDASGNYTLEHLQPGEYQVYVPELEVKNSSFAAIAVSAGQAVTGIDFAVAPSVPLVGTVVEADGKPVPDAELKVPRRADNPIKTKADGSFVIEDIGPRMSVYLAAKKDGRLSEVYGPIRRDDARKGEIVLTLRPSGSIEGRVVDESGNPVTDVRVEAAMFLRGLYLSTGAQVDNSGHFLIEGVTSAVYELKVTKPPRRTGGPVQNVLRELFETREERQRAWRETMRPLAPVKHVRATLSNRVSGVVLTVSPPETNSLWGTTRRANGGSLKNATLTIDDLWCRNEDCAHFRFDGLPDKPLALLLDHGNYSAYWAVTELNRALDIVIPEPATVSGRVIDASTGQPVRMFTVGRSPTLVSGKTDIGVPFSRGAEYGPGLEFVKYQNAEGRFRMGNVYGEHTAIEIHAQGYFHESVTVDIPPAGGNREGIEVRVTPCPPIEGKVLSAEGNPVADAFVNGYRERTRPRGNAMLAMTDDQGAFRLDNYPRDMIGLRAGRSRSGSGSVTIKAEEAIRAPVTIVLHQGGAVEVSAKRETETLFEGRVQLFRDDAGPWTSALGNEADGTAAFLNIPAGEAMVRYSLTQPYSMPYRCLHTRRVTIREGEKVKVEFSLPEKLSTLRGSVTLSGQPVSRGRVTATSPMSANGEQIVGESPIDRRGCYFLVDLPGGVYTIEAKAESKEGRTLSMQMDVDLAAGQDYTQDLDLAP